MEQLAIVVVVMLLIFCAGFFTKTAQVPASLLGMFAISLVFILVVLKSQPVIDAQLRCYGRVDQLACIDRVPYGFFMWILVVIMLMAVSFLFGQLMSGLVDTRPTVGKKRRAR